MSITHEEIASFCTLSERFSRKLGGYNILYEHTEIGPFGDLWGVVERNDIQGRLRSHAFRITRDAFFDSANTYSLRNENEDFSFFSGEEALRVLNHWKAIAQVQWEKYTILATRGREGLHAVARERGWTELERLLDLLGKDVDACPYMLSSVAEDPRFEWKASPRLVVGGIRDGHRSREVLLVGHLNDIRNCRYLDFNYLLNRAVDSWSYGWYGITRGIDQKLALDGPYKEAVDALRAIHAKRQKETT